MQVIQHQHQGQMPGQRLDDPGVLLENLRLIQFDWPVGMPVEALLHLLAQPGLVGGEGGHPGQERAARHEGFDQVGTKLEQGRTRQAQQAFEALGVFGAEGLGGQLGVDIAGEQGQHLAER